MKPVEMKPVEIQLNLDPQGQEDKKDRLKSKREK